MPATTKSRSCRLRAHERTIGASRPSAALSASGSERQRHVNHAVQRIVVVRGAIAEAEIRVERARRRHPLERVELELAIADAPRLRDQRAGEPLAPAFAAMRRLHVETL